MVLKLKNFHCLYSAKKNWKKVTNANYQYLYTGSSSFITKLINDFKLQTSKSIDKKKITKYLLNKNTNSSLIFFSSNVFIAFTSISRDFPIFLKKKKDYLIISNDIYKLMTDGYNIDKQSLAEFYSCGYVLQDRTLAHKIYSLGPAEIIYGDKENSKISRSKYFEYHKSLKKRNLSEKEFFSIFNEILDNIFNDLIDEVGDSPIYIPLSGGLDSRLVLSKLCEKKVKNIHCFSYGLKNNSDALKAKKICEHLDVRWDFFEFRKAEFRSMYFSQFKKNYDKFADNFSVLPNYQDIFFLRNMQIKNFFKKNAYIINGQSGDFNSGMHIPSCLYKLDQNSASKDYEVLISQIIHKHFNLSKNTKHFPKMNFKDSLKLNLDKIEGNFLSDIYECWEYEERQCKYVVNGQRAYEYLNLNWYLPLWHSEFVKFWTTVPLKYRFRQNLYRNFLNQWNYKNLFEALNKPVTAFTGYQENLVKLLSFSLGVIMNKKKKNQILNYLDYFSRLGVFYQIFNFSYFIKNRSRVKNAIPFHIEEWLKKNIT